MSTVAEGEVKSEGESKEGSSKALSPVARNVTHTSHTSRVSQPQVSAQPILPTPSGSPMPEAHTASDASSGISSPRPNQTSPQRSLSPCRRFSITPLDLRVSSKDGQLENLVPPEQPMKSGRAVEESPEANQGHLSTPISSLPFSSTHARSKSLPDNVNLNVPLFFGIKDPFTAKDREMPEPLPQSSVVVVAARHSSMPLAIPRPVFPSTIFPGSFQGIPSLGDGGLTDDAPNPHIVKEYSNPGEQVREAGERKVATGRVLDLPRDELVFPSDGMRERSSEIAPLGCDGEVSKHAGIDSRASSLSPKVGKKEQERAIPGQVVYDSSKRGIVNSSTNLQRKPPEALTALRDRISYHSFDQLPGHAQIVKGVDTIAGVKKVEGSSSSYKAAEAPRIKDPSVSAASKGLISYGPVNAPLSVERASKGKRSSTTGNGGTNSRSGNQGQFAQKASEEAAGSAVARVPSSLALDMKGIEAKARDAVNKEAESPGHSGLHSPRGSSATVIQELKDIISEELKRLSTKATPPAPSGGKGNHVQLEELMEEGKGYSPKL